MAHLVRVSNEEIIHLPEGENFIGRGALLQVTNKHVSRNHALLRLSSGSFSLCPKHSTNACFYQAANQTTYISMEKDQWKDLEHGDCFSFLPAGELAFRVVSEAQANSTNNKAATLPQEELTPPPSSSDPPGQGSSTSHAELPVVACAAPAIDAVDDMLFGDQDADTASGIAPKSTLQEARMVEEQGGDEAKHPPEDEATTGDMESTSEHGSNGEDTVSSVPSGNTNKPRVLPGWLCDISASSGAAGRGGGGGGGAAKKRRAPSGPKRQQASQKNDNDSPKLPPAKKPAGGRGLKKNSAAGVEADEGLPPPSTSGTGNPAAGPEASGPAAEPAARPLCPYGSKCYRVNPVHFRDFSHVRTKRDSDSDEEVEPPAKDERSECPFGANCYRKNPAHHLEYKHPSSASRQTPSNRQLEKDRDKPIRELRIREPKKSVIVGDEDDDSQPNTYDYTDSFIDDKEDGSSTSTYASEDSDWVPEEKAGGNKEEEEEDVAELVTEAEEFIKNKKMR